MKKKEIYGLPRSPFNPVRLSIHCSDSLQEKEYQKLKSIISKFESKSQNKTDKKKMTNLKNTEGYKLVNSYLRESNMNMEDHIIK